MKIGIINGSPRRDGATAKVLKEIYKQLKQQDAVRLEYVDLSALDAQFCLGCERCYATGQCVIKNDGVGAVAEKIKKCDGIIWGTPTHGGSISALLKNFMDRGHFTVEQSLYNKKCMSVVTYEIADGISAMKQLNKFFRVSGGHIANKVLVRTGFNVNPLNLKLNSQLKQKTDRFYKDVKEDKRRSLFEYIFNDLIVVNLIWKPFFKKHFDQYRGVVEKYENAGIHAKLVKTVRGSKR